MTNVRSHLSPGISVRPINHMTNEAISVPGSQYDPSITGLMWEAITVPGSQYDPSITWLMWEVISVPGSQYDPSITRLMWEAISVPGSQYDPSDRTNVRSHLSPGISVRPVNHKTNEAISVPGSQYDPSITRLMKPSQSRDLSMIVTVYRWPTEPKTIICAWFDSIPLHQGFNVALG